MTKKFAVSSEGPNHTAGNLGDLDAANLMKYAVANPATGKPFPGKVFLGESLSATGMEVSFQVMPPDTGMPFSHKHRENEELYFVLKGNGEFQVDDVAIPVREGSVVRVAPDGSRGWRNTGAEPMIMMCVQAAAGALRKFGSGDGYLS